MYLSNDFRHMGMFGFANFRIAGLNEELQVRWDAKQSDEKRHFAREPDKYVFQQQPLT